MIFVGTAKNTCYFPLVVVTSRFLWSKKKKVFLVDDSVFLSVRSRDAFHVMRSLHYFMRSSSRMTSLIHTYFSIDPHVYLKLNGDYFFFF